MDPATLAQQTTDILVLTLPVIYAGSRAVADKSKDILFEGGKVVVDKRKDMLLEKCIEKVGSETIDRAKKVIVAHPEYCIECKWCMEACPEDVINFNES